MGEYVAPPLEPYLNFQLLTADDLSHRTSSGQVYPSHPRSPDEPLTSDDESSGSDDDAGFYTTSTRQHLRAARRSCSYDHNEGILPEPNPSRTRSSTEFIQAESGRQYNAIHAGGTGPCKSAQGYDQTSGASILVATIQDTGLPRSMIEDLQNSATTPPSNAFEAAKRLCHDPPPSTKSRVPLAICTNSKEFDQVGLSPNGSVDEEDVVQKHATVLSFESECSLRHKTIEVDDHSPGQGPVVNHLHATERRNNVHRVIEGIERVFEPQLAAEELATNLELRKDELAEMRLGTSMEDSCIWMEYWSSTGMSSMSDSANSSKLAASQLALDGIPAHKVKENNKDSQPVDGKDGTGEATGNDGGNLQRATSSHSGPYRHRSIGSGGRDKRGPYERPNQNRTPGMPSSSVTSGRGFCCVFDHPGNPNPDCKKCHRYVSELRVHHGGNGHRFFYCAICFTDFATKEERDQHDSRHCPNPKCVTVGCQNHNSDSLPSCNHPGRTNSQVSVYKALFKLARPNDPIPFEIGAGIDALSAPGWTSTPATPANSNSMPSSQSDVFARRTSNGEALSSPYSPQLTRTTSFSYAPSCSDGSYIQALRTLASSLLKQVEGPDPDGLDVLEDMYNSYLDENMPQFFSQCGSNQCTALVNGLKRLCRKMWIVAQNPDDASPTSKGQLRDWAYGVLPQFGTPSVSIAASPSARPQSQQPQTPIPMVATSSKDKQHQALPIDITTVDARCADMNDLPGNSFYGNNALPDLEFNPYNQPADVMHPLFGNLASIHLHQPLGAAPMYYPWTHGDSAEAFPPEGEPLTKSRTGDSAYGTGRTNNSF